MGLPIFALKEPVANQQTEGTARPNPLWGNLYAPGRARAEGVETWEVLKRIPIFEGLTKRELSGVERILYRRTYEPNEPIFHQADPGLGMYIIVDGCVAILSGPSQKQLAELRDGDFFGELALLDELPRSATAIARTQSTIVGLFQPDFFAFIERNPRLGVKIVLPLARIIGRRLRATHEGIPTTLG